MRAALVLLSASVACANAKASGPMPSLPDDRAPPVQTSTLAEPYRRAAEEIIARATTSSGAYQKLEHLTDDVGNRLSGSPSLERAIIWAVRTLKEDGHENIHTEKVLVPHWERGASRAAIVAPSPHALHVLALGGSGGTPSGGVKSEVVVLASLEDLDAHASEVKGKIVLFNRAMPGYGPKGSGYGETVPIRSQGPSRAAKLGAKAALVRSVTAKSLSTPHTGATRFEPGQTPIPAVAVTAEDADLIARMAKRGPVEVELELGAKILPDADSANVIGELVGRERPEEVVLLGAHLDSWDVGQGAHDDGAGVAMVMEALTVLRDLGLRPRRTIRAVLYTNEENGLRGGLAYAKEHAAEASHLIAAIESDSGGFLPRGFRVEKGGIALARVAKIATLLAPIGATDVQLEDSGADVGALRDTGAALLGLEVEGSKYFDYHHSDADTFDKVSKDELQKCVAALAVMGYVLAELPVGVGER